MRALLFLTVLLAAGCDIPQADECKELLAREDCTGLDDEAAGENGTCWRTTPEAAEECRTHCQQSLDACDDVDPNPDAGT
jgi:hypothetical protein